jgi:hypothetical protein
MAGPTTFAAIGPTAILGTPKPRPKPTPAAKVGASTPTYHVSFDYDDETDPGAYPIPSNPKIEGGSDENLILWDTQGRMISARSAPEAVPRGRYAMPAFRSSSCSSSYAARSTALWRHSAARNRTAMIPVRWIRRKSPNTNA